MEGRVKEKKRMEEKKKSVGSSSKELLQLEKEGSGTAASALESSLLLFGRNSGVSQPRAAPSDGKLVTTPLPESDVLGRVRDLLGRIAEQPDLKDDSQNYDIEALTGNESHVIEMDLMLGVAELQNEQAVAAAESALAGALPVITLDGSSSSSSESNSECSSDDDDDDDDERDRESADDDEGSVGNDNVRKDTSSKEVSRRKPKKQPKIEMLSSSV